MPGGDGTGPRGGGPGTGWGRGGCVPMGRGRRFWGRGMFRNFFASFSVKDEIEELRSERDAINSRLTELEKEKK